MKLFPASASPRALESLASHAYDAWKTQPTASERRAMDDDERRYQRCMDLCAQSFDTVDQAAEEWLETQDDEVRDIAYAAIRGNDDDLRAAITRLRDRYLDRAPDYMERVAAEEQDEAEEAAADDWEWTHG